MKLKLRSQEHADSFAAPAAYPRTWVQEGDSAFEEYLYPYFERLSEFLKKASSESQALFMYFH